MPSVKCSILGDKVKETFVWHGMILPVGIYFLRFHYFLFLLLGFYGFFVIRTSLGISISLFLLTC